VVTALTASLSIGAGAAGTGYRLESRPSALLTARLTSLFLSAERRTHTLSATAQVSLVLRDHYVGADGTTHLGKPLLDPLAAVASGRTTWALAYFVPAAHSALRDQVALQDGGNVAIFESSPVWHVVKVGLGVPYCVASVLDRFAPTPVTALWRAKGCQ
jgi:hypothetical protein